MTNISRRSAFGVAGSAAAAIVALPVAAAADQTPAVLVNGAISDKPPVKPWEWWGDRSGYTYREGPFSTREEAIKMSEPGSGICEAIEGTPFLAVDLDDLSSIWLRQNEGRFGDDGTPTLDDFMGAKITDEMQTELETEIEQVIWRWVNRHGLTPTVRDFDATRNEETLPDEMRPNASARQERG